MFLFAATYHYKLNLLSFTLSVKCYMELFRKNIVALRKGLFNTNKIKHRSSSLSSAASRYSVPTMQAHKVIISHHDSKPVFESSVIFQY